MCFSASASFGAGVALSIAGILTLKNVKSSSQILFATIPLLFAAHQFIETLVWFSLTKAEYSGWASVSTMLYLVFAQVIWPTLVPLSILLLEKENQIKKFLFVFTLLGFTASMYLAWCLYNYPVKAVIEEHHVRYLLDFPHVVIWTSCVFYFIPTVVSPLIASYKKVSLLGVLILLSYIFSALAYADFLISVWCFFAAMISATILYIITKMNKSDLSGL